MNTELAVVVTEVTLLVTIDITGPIDLQKKMKALNVGHYLKALFSTSFEKLWLKV